MAQYNPKKIKEKFEEMLEAFDAIQMPRTPYVLEELVVNTKFTEEQKYAQCVLEMQVAYDNLRTAQIHQDIKNLEIAELKKKNDKKSKLEIELKQIELEQNGRAILGAKREFGYLFSLWEKFPKRYTRKQLDLAQKEEYRMRLETQALHDLNATGRITQSNQEGLRQIGKVVYPQLDFMRDVEKRFLEKGNVKMMLAVPTEKKAEKGIACIEGLDIPNGAQFKIYNSWGKPTDESYNHIVQTALEDHADYIITIEDDTYPPKDAIPKLLDLYRKQKGKCAVGAWYPKKNASLEGVHIVLDKGERQHLPADGKVHEVYTLAMGCSIYPIEMFMEIPYPWFKTTTSLTQDSYFSQLAREAGYKLLVDTSIRCKHIDRVTGEVYE